MHLGWYSDRILTYGEDRDGNDGPWSSVGIQIGTPSQNVRLFPGTSATTGTTVWVVRPEGCTEDDPSDCGDNRGFLFHPNESSTWSIDGLSNNGLYDLTVFEENILGYSGNASYGFDNVTLGWQTDGLPELSHQVVAGYAAKDFYIGSLGISPHPELFETFNDPQPSLLATLRNQSLIPSVSWAYTAGAYYREPKVYGSLVLGGYDDSRLARGENETGIDFPFGADISRDLLIGIREISSDTVGTPLLSHTIYAFIDSLVPHLWLPLEVCTAFEQAFNLTWNSTAELYLLTEDQHTKLMNLNANVTFNLGTDGIENYVNVVMPYGAFDLVAGSPIVESPMHYFPLKRAQNDTQYTLGRAFLQQAYVIADYDRKTFQVWQASFPPARQEHIVAILPPGAALESSRKNGLSKGQIAGIVCSMAIFFAIILVAWSCMQRRKRRQGLIPSLPFNLKNVEEMKPFEKPELDHESTQVAQLDDLPVAELEMTERYELCAYQDHNIRGSTQNGRAELNPAITENTVVGRRELADNALVGVEMSAEPARPEKDLIREE